MSKSVKPRRRKVATEPAPKEPMTISRDDLDEVLIPLGKLVERRNAIPILAYVRLEGFVRKLRLVGSDLDNELTCGIRAKNGERWQTTVPVEALQKVVRNIPAGAEISLAYDEATAKLSVATDVSSFEFNTLPAADHPRMTAFEYSHEFEVPSDVLAEMIGRTQFAISKEETCYHLNGIYLEPTTIDRRIVLRAVATDGCRMATYDIKRPAGATKMPPVIVPRKAISLISMLLREGKSVSLEVGTKAVITNVGPFRLISKLIDGTYPDYRRVMPKDFERSIKTAISALDGAVQRVASFRGRQVYVKINLGQPQSAILEANNPDYGIAREKLALTFQGEPIEIGFNSQYLRDVLKALKADEVEIDLVGSSDPARFRPVGTPQHQVILMPMRV